MSITEANPLTYVSIAFPSSFDGSRTSSVEDVTITVSSVAFAKIGKELANPFQIVSNTK